MTAYSQARGAVPPRPAPARPISAVVATAAVVVAGLGGVLTGVLALTTGEAAVTEYLGGFAENSLLDLAVDEAMTLLTGRAYVWMVIGALVALAGLLVRKAGVGARVFAAIMLLVSTAWGLFNWVDLEVIGMHTMPLVVALISVFASVVIWLPSVHRYGKALKQR